VISRPVSLLSYTFHSFTVSSIAVQKMRAKIKGKTFQVREVDADQALAGEICSDCNHDLKLSINGVTICIKYGVDKMWISDGKSLYMVKPKTYIVDELRELLHSILGVSTLAR